ncbi:hypothetical protein WME77_12010 [Sorangium sp. So ce764]|uniref:hypothetical protein n=1 Tax=Sorangium sp. So ce764 TaxID=3133320 RepID=UPI003F607CF9
MSGDHGEMCPKPKRAPHKDEDLVIAADDGKIYYLRREHFMRPEFEITQEKCAPCYDRTTELLRQGVSLAWIKPRPGNQACYLVNLSSLRRVTPFEKPTPRSESEDPIEDVLMAAEGADLAASQATASALAMDLDHPEEALSRAVKVLESAEQAAKYARTAIQGLTERRKTK